MCLYILLVGIYEKRYAMTIEIFDVRGSVHHSIIHIKIQQYATVYYNLFHTSPTTFHEIMQNQRLLV